MKYILSLQNKVLRPIGLLCFIIIIINIIFSMLATLNCFRQFFKYQLMFLNETSQCYPIWKVVPTQLLVINHQLQWLCQDSFVNLEIRLVQS